MKKSFFKIILFLLLCIPTHISFAEFNLSPDEVIAPVCNIGDDCNIGAGVDKITDNVHDIEKNRTFTQYIQEVGIYVIGFLFILSLIFLIYAGFQILTASGDDGKVKKAKHVITFVLMGLVIIFLAYSIVGWIISILK